jgi:hypothetical protein
MRRPAKKNNKGLLGAVGAAVIGLAAGAAAVFLSKKENREKVKRTVGTAVKKGKVEVAKAKKKVVATKKKLLRRK